MTPQRQQALGDFLSQCPEILFAYSFGSQVSGIVGPLSDMDVAVFTKEALPFNRRMEIHSDAMKAALMAKVDLVDLRLAPPVLAYEIVSSGQLLFSKDVDAQNDFERRAIMRYFDTAHLRNIQNHYLREHLKAS